MLQVVISNELYGLYLGERTCGLLFSCKNAHAMSEAPTFNSEAEARAELERLGCEADEFDYRLVRTETRGVATYTELAAAGLASHAGLQMELNAVYAASRKAA